jgi:Flp pilus assembly protein TadG
MKIKGFNQRGAFLVIFALVLLVLLGFTALGIEAGRWYLVRAELSKSVDAAALAAAKNISNPTVDAKTLAEEFGFENFKAGYLGTPGLGVGEVQFSAHPLGSDTFQVTGNVNAPVGLARLFGIDQVPVVAVAAAQEATKKKTEIMLVLDRTGSMGNPGYKLRDLKSAATSFVENFRGTQDKDKMGLISFATDVKVEVPLRDQFVDAIESKISTLIASGATNMEDAIDQADGPEGLRNQSRLDKSDKLQQNVVFFSDGMPTAFRYTFMTADRNYDSVASVAAVAHNAQNCRPGPGEAATMEVWFYSPTVPPYVEGAQMGPAAFGLSAYTGDGRPQNKSKSTCIARDTTKWDIFYTGYGPVPGYAKDACYIPTQNQALYTCATARQMAIDKAKELKDNGIKIYVVGLGSDDDIDLGLLQAISSGDKYTYIARDSGELAGIFNKIAKEIKLRLVQ